MNKIVTAATVAAMLAAATPAFAYGNSVHNFNGAFVGNSTTVNANTGNNASFAQGGKGGTTGTHSNANGGAANNTGSVNTGAATAGSVTFNLVNSNATSAQNGHVHNGNFAIVGNTSHVGANTGNNTVDAFGGNGGKTGSDSNANGGYASNSGNVTTGAANAHSTTVNVVNTNLTRTHY